MHLFCLLFSFSVSSFPSSSSSSSSPSSSSSSSLLPQQYRVNQMGTRRRLTQMDRMYLHWKVVSLEWSYLVLGRDSILVLVLRYCHVRILCTRVSLSSVHWIALRKVHLVSNLFLHLMSLGLDNRWGSPPSDTPLQWAPSCQRSL